MADQSGIICIGSVLWDVIGRASGCMSLGSDEPGKIKRSPGGVTLNVARKLHGFGMQPTILSAIGTDRDGDELLGEIMRMGLDCHHVYRSDDLPTDSYIAIEADNGLIAAVASTHSLEACGDKVLQPLTSGALSTTDTPITLDGNLHPKILQTLSTAPLLKSSDLRIVAASPSKARRLNAFTTHSSATLYLNLEEAGLLCETEFPDSTTAAVALIERGAYRVLVTDGENAVSEVIGTSIITQMPPAVSVSQVTGAGDTLVAAHIASEVQGKSREAALNSSLKAVAAHVSGRVQS
ncbi:MAG: PfkB family carbohydrate kinase [Hyphomicrobiaceae bacterium]